MEFAKILPWNTPLTDFKIIQIIDQTYLKSLFQGVFSRDELLERTIPPLKFECAIINLDTKLGRGTHWTAYFKHDSRINYYDSFGNLQPPREFVHFFQKFDIFYNRECDQEFNSIICGHLSLCFLFHQFTLYLKGQDE